MLLQAIIEGATGLKWDEEEEVEEKADDDEDVYPEEPFDEDGNIVPDVEDLEDDQEVLDSLDVPLVPLVPETQEGQTQVVKDVKQFVGQQEKARDALFKVSKIEVSQTFETFKRLTRSNVFSSVSWRNVSNIVRLTDEFGTQSVPT
jgi:hypothetical protein